jgi:hypothetical protein
MLYCTQRNLYYVHYDFLKEECDLFPDPQTFSVKNQIAGILDLVDYTVCVATAQLLM